MKEMVKGYDNYKLKKGQLVALTNVIEAIVYSKDSTEDKISKIKYWFNLKEKL